MHRWESECEHHASLQLVEGNQRFALTVRLPEGYFTALEGHFQAQEDAARLISLLRPSR